MVKPWHGKQGAIHFALIPTHKAKQGERVAFALSHGLASVTDEPCHT